MMKPPLSKGFINPKNHICDPAGTRTQDPYIKSVMLYQLSYGISSHQKGYTPCFERAKIVENGLRTNYLCLNVDMWRENDVFVLIYKVNRP